ncbi:hypothetical protein ACF1BN_21600 [Streptomyces sp. NPDC014861]|uniref:hypothetical protein n=1 Tax=Streptomyces sp. NPDC014861 TaxID=3364923 RepID=UPI0036FA79A8
MVVPASRLRPPAGCADAPHARQSGLLLADTSVVEILADADHQGLTAVLAHDPVNAN